MAQVRIPTPLRRLTHGQEVVQADASTVGELIAVLEQNYPGFKDRLLDEKGQVRRFINIFVGEEDIRYLQALDTPLQQGTEVSIVPAIAGG
ncbi:MAG: MoaD/ThiS family protein [Myxococcales bacterium]|nr:MoaD/ThiS family protein [Myxococcota bacterium]MDW8284439.1 MoaD/ThiS family protein [Myxococcales bacterium]